MDPVMFPRHHLPLLAQVIPQTLPDYESATLAVVRH
jgi:hypothetical protein